MGNSSSVPLRLRRRRYEEPSPIDLLYTKSSGLYPTCSWDDKHVRRLILRGELAPRYPGKDDPTSTVREECPICMLIYPVLNQTKCCSARLCTECYLQIRPPRHNKEPCPFCKYKRLEATCKGPRSADDLDREERDQISALEAIKRASAAALSADPARNLITAPPRPTPSSATVNVQVAQPVSSSQSAYRPAAQTTASFASSFSSSSSSTLHMHTPRETDPVMSPVYDAYTPYHYSAASSHHIIPSDSTTSPPSVLATAASSASSPSLPTPSTSSSHQRCPDARTCSENHRTHFVPAYQPTNADPLVLETMATEATYYATSDNDKPSSLRVLLRSAEQGSSVVSDPPCTSDEAPQLPAVLHLPWHDTDQSVNTTAGPSSSLQFSQEHADMDEAIRRSLIEM
ncbi:Protein SIP5 [Gracilariopsis chorda]|uniref:Protein SIP5 n=1 Tax=Gracilariopsis chorda TaxID=448386 RepID=A0A2V3IF09_9FLOR|nr:Protein SIP5 [Gracilariopsis chorda]|eukprot:PXF40654.1 Protein SIP5 [Gracilariopsis chorda]